MTEDKTTGFPRQRSVRHGETARLLARCAGPQEELADCGLEFAIRRGESRDFELRFLALAGIRQAECDCLEAEITALFTPRDPSLQAEGDASAAQLCAPAERPRDDPEALARAAAESQRAIPEDLNKHFRQVAHANRSDLAADGGDRVVRERQMVEASIASAAGDVHQASAVLDESQSRQKASSGDSVTVRLLRLIRAVDAVEERPAEPAFDITTFAEGSHAALSAQAQQARVEGRDLLREFAIEVRRRIAVVSLRLREPAGVTEHDSG